MLHRLSPQTYYLHACLNCVMVCKVTYSCLKAIFSAETGPAGGPPPPVLKENCSGFVEQGFFTVQTSFLLPNHYGDVLKGTQRIHPTSGLASSFLHPPPDSWRKGRCSLYTGSLRPLPVMYSSLSAITEKLKDSAKEIDEITTTTIIQPLYRTTCVRWYPS